MKHALIRLFGFALLLAALHGPGAARAQTEDDLSFCEGDFYTHYVKDVLITIPTAPGVPDSFAVTIGLDGKPILVKRRKADDPDTWGGQAHDSFFLNSIDLHPKIPGFTVSGPESCQYQVIQERDGKRCAARYEFSVRRMKVKLQAEPSEAAVRLMVNDEPAPSPDARCVPPSDPHRLADRQLEAKVRAALQDGGSLDSFVIDVTAQGKDVRLSGLVNSKVNSKVKLSAEMIAHATGAHVENKLRVDDNCVGTALIEAGQSITIVIEAGGEVFAATLDVPTDFLEKRVWEVNSKLLQKAPHTLAAGDYAKRFAVNKDDQHGRTAGLVQKALGKQGDLKSITIRRDEW